MRSLRRTDEDVDEVDGMGEVDGVGEVDGADFRRGCGWARLSLLLGGGHRPP